MPSFTTALKSLRNRTHQERKFLHTFPQTTHCGLSAGYVLDSGWRRKKSEKLHPNLLSSKKVGVLEIRKSRSSFSPSNNGYMTGVVILGQSPGCSHGNPWHSMAAMAASRCRGANSPCETRTFPSSEIWQTASRDPRDPTVLVSRPRLRFRKKIPWIRKSSSSCFRNFTISSS